MYKILVSCLCLILSLPTYAEPRLYLIKPDDSLAQVLRSLNYGNSYAELLPLIQQTVDLNPKAFKHKNPNLLVPGTEITLPKNPNEPEPIAEPEPETVVVPEPTPLPEPEPPIGRINMAKGVSDILRETDSLIVDQQENIYVDDIILTREKTQAEIILNDDSIITLGPNSQLVVNEFSFSRNRKTGDQTEDSLIATINKGVMRIITGLIGKNRKNQFAIRSAFSASIGIRGTDFTIRTCLEKTGCGDLFGVSAAVKDGGINLKNETAVLSLDKNEFAQVKSAVEAPQKAPLPEGFFDLDRDPANISVSLSWWEKTLDWVKSKL